jgi:glyoxylase-like metal-dependent hydrolase (beta-lactamase superfamily II)
MSSLPIADRWFDHRAISADVTLLWEPHVIELMRCNIWHVRGRDRDLVIDTGMGVASLVDALAGLTDRPVTAAATHGHGDHIGGHHEFDDVIVHPAEAADLEAPDLQTLDVHEAWGQAAIDGLEAAGYSLDAELFVTALPAGMTLESFGQRASKVTRLVEEGDVIDLGDRHFEVLHLPGHSPGSIGLWEPATRTLFSGDAIYDGPLLDELVESNIADYCATMERLIDLPVDIVHGGHDPSFGRDRLQEIARGYLAKRQ